MVACQDAQLSGLWAPMPAERPIRSQLSRPSDLSTAQHVVVTECARCNVSTTTGRATPMSKANQSIRRQAYNIHVCSTMAMIGRVSGATRQHPCPRRSPRPDKPLSRQSQSLLVWRDGQEQKAARIQLPR